MPGAEKNIIGASALCQLWLVWPESRDPDRHARRLGGARNELDTIDEIAAAIGADPVAFRLRYLKAPRDIAVVKAAAEHRKDNSVLRENSRCPRTGKSGPIRELNWEIRYCLARTGYVAAKTGIQ
jgi:hypothetical protein